MRNSSLMGGSQKSQVITCPGRKKGRKDQRKKDP
jgi:hypothetical protein